MAKCVDEKRNQKFIGIFNAGARVFVCVTHAHVYACVCALKFLSVIPICSNFGADFNGIFVVSYLIRIYFLGNYKMCICIY